MSDDTILLLSAAEALIKESNADNIEKLYRELAYQYKNDCEKDMKGRAAGPTTEAACSSLKPLASKDWYIPFNSKGAGLASFMIKSLFFLDLSIFHFP